MGEPSSDQDKAAFERFGAVPKRSLVAKRMAKGGRKFFDSADYNKNQPAGAKKAAANLPHKGVADPPKRSGFSESAEPAAPPAAADGDAPAAPATTEANA